MKCPFCNHEDHKVVDSRPAEKEVRRRRECLNCNQRFTTYERVEEREEIKVLISRNGEIVRELNIS